MPSRNGQEKAKSSHWERKYTGGREIPPGGTKDRIQDVIIIGQTSINGCLQTWLSKKMEQSNLPATLTTFIQPDTPRFIAQLKSWSRPLSLYGINVLLLISTTIQSMVQEDCTLGSHTLKTQSMCFPQFFWDEDFDSDLIPAMKIRSIGILRVLSQYLAKRNRVSRLVIRMR